MQIYIYKSQICIFPDAVVTDLCYMEESAKNMEFEGIKAMFETGKIKKLTQLEKLSPTKLSKLLGINYGRYIEKLHNPELFAIRELIKFAEIIDIDFKLLIDTVVVEIIKKAKNQ